MTERPVTHSHPEMALASRQALAIMLLCLIFGATALGATSPKTACDRTADLQSLEVPVSDLSTTVVGHVVADPEAQDDAAVDVLSSQDISVAPILDLAPRVAVILQDVFSAVAIETPASDSSEQPLPLEPPLSPVAGDASQSESPHLPDPATGIEDMANAPSIHRQMFRTDI